MTTSNLIIFANQVGTIPLADLDHNFSVVSNATSAATVTTNAQPNITSVGTLTTLSVSGNIVGNLFIGDGSGLSNVTAVSNVGVASQLVNGTTSFDIPDANGNIVGNVGGTGNVYTFTNLGFLVSGYTSISGNITGGNLLTVGNISATGYVFGDGSRLTSLSAANIVGTVANATYALSANTANVANRAANATYATTAGSASFATTATQAEMANTVTTNAQPNITSVGTLTSLSVTGNVVGGLFTGNGAGLTGMYGNSNVANYLPTYTGNITAGNISVNGVVTIASATGNVLATSGNIGVNRLYSIGVSSAGNIRAANFFTSSSTEGVISASGNVYGDDITAANNLYGNNISASGNIDIGNVIATGVVSAAGNIRGGNINTNGLVYGNIIYGNSSGIFGTVNANLISSTGNVYGFNVIAANTVTANLFVGTFQGNITGNLVVPGANTQVLYNNNGNAGADGGFTYDSDTQAVSVTGNVNANYFIGDGSLLTGIAASSSLAGNLVGNIDANSYYINNLPSLSVTGNVSGNYFIGDGSQLTNLPAGNYSNSNVAAYLPTYTGNLTAGNVSATGNIEGTYFIGNGSQLTGLPTSLAGNLVGNINANTFYINDLPSLSVTGNTQAGNLLTSGNVSATGNVSGNYIIGDGSQLTNLPAGNYSNSNVAAYLPTYTGNLTAGNISATGNIEGTYFIGNGSQLTGLPANYSNSNVADYLPTYSGNILAGNISVSGNSVIIGNITTGNITTTGNVSANYVIGDGSQLTGITTSLAGNLVGNIDANSYYINNLPSLSVTGNTQAGNLLTSGLISATGNVRGGNINTAGGVYADSISVSGNIVSNVTYGAFYDTTTQINTSVGNAIPMSFNTTDINNGVTIAGAGNTNITIAKTGIYNIQFSAQFTKYDAGTDVVNIWLDKNGTTVPASGGEVSLVGNGGKVMATWNYLVNASAGDYYRLMWMSADANASILYITASSPVPDIPSIILTVVPVGP